MNNYLTGVPYGINLKCSQDRLHNDADRDELNYLNIYSHPDKLKGY